MKRITNRKLRIAMTFKVFENGKTLSSVTKYKKSQIFRAIEAISFTKSKITSIRVSYGIGVNESEHCSKKSLLNALTIYTERKLIDSMEQ